MIALLQEIATAGQRAAEATEKLAAAVAELAKQRSTVVQNYYPQPSVVPHMWPPGTITC